MRGTDLRTLKLYINARTNTVVFAEAGKRCVDFIFGILSLPMSTFVGMVRDLGMEGSLGNIRTSFEQLDYKYIHPGVTKTALLQPMRASTHENPLTVFLYGSMFRRPHLNDDGGDGDDEDDGDGHDKPDNNVMAIYDADNDADDDVDYEEDDDDDDDDDDEGDYDDEVEEEGSTEALFYKCPECKNSGYSVDMRTVCPECSRQMTSVMKYVSIGSEFDGYVKDMATYMVMDDLVVKPLSTDSVLTLLQEINGKDVTVKEVRITLKEALMLLKTSLHSKNVLTEVFIKTN